MTKCTTLNGLDFHIIMDGAYRDSILSSISSSAGVVTRIDLQESHGQIAIIGHNNGELSELFTGNICSSFESEDQIPPLIASYKNIHSGEKGVSRDEIYADTACLSMTGVGRMPKAPSN